MERTRPTTRQPAGETNKVGSYMSHAPGGGCSHALYGLECDMQPSLASQTQDILDVTALAARHHSTPATIRKLNSRDPARLPPRLLLGGRILLWRLVDVEAWEAVRVAGACAPAPTPPQAAARRGPKSTAAKARAACDASAGGAA